MTVEVLSGKEIASEIRKQVATEASALKSTGVSPSLAVVVATGDESTEFYVKHIVSAAEKTGVLTNIIRLGSKAKTAEIASELNRLASDSSTHGIILQTPLPDGVNADDLRSLIPLEKDVDGASPLSAGRLISGLDTFVPSTAVAVMEILNGHDIAVGGVNVVIVGRSRVVGKPLAHLLLDADATVTICHSKTRKLADITKSADILVVAIGQPQMINANHLNKGAIVIDVGTNPTDDGGLVGDVNTASIQHVAGAYSPVPGGVGPVTTAILLRQTIQACKNSLKVSL